MKLQSLASWAAIALAAVGVTACGGASGAASAYGVTPSATANPAASATPTTTPTASPSNSPSTAPSTTLTEATLLGAAGFTNTNGRTVYILSDDTTTTLACTVISGCTGVWPPIAPPSGVALTTGFTAFTRSDNGATQLAYNGHPLYEYAGDSGAGQTNGNDLMSFGGTWSVARP